VNKWKRALPALASIVVVLTVMVIALSLTSHLGEVVLLTAGVLLLIRLLVRRHSIALLGSPAPRHGDRMD